MSTLFSILKYMAFVNIIRMYLSMFFKYETLHLLYSYIFRAASE